MASTKKIASAKLFFQQIQLGNIILFKPIISTHRNLQH